MLKSYISLEVRILLPSSERAFRKEGKEFFPYPPGVRKAYLLIRNLGGAALTEVPFERSLSLFRPDTAHPDVPLPELSGLSLQLGAGAYLDIMFHRRKKRIRISCIRLEEDAGRLVRPVRNGVPETRMDYSTAGMPSLRLRTESDFEIGEEAGVFLSALRRRIQYLELFEGTAAGNPEAHIRCNAYVALAPYPEKPETFVKLRNLNSLNFVWKATNAELSRQEELLAAGKKITGESRLWNEAKNATESYHVNRKAWSRYEAADLPPFHGEPYLPGGETAELPEDRRDRLTAGYGLTYYQAEFICDERSRADYFEKTAALGADPKEAARWMVSWVFKETRRLGLSLADSPLSPGRFALVLAMLRDKRIHGIIARRIITAVLENNADPEDLVRDRGWEQLSDPGRIRNLVRDVVAANPGEVRRIREGDAGPIRYLTGLIMKETGGRAEPALVKDILREELHVSLVYVLAMGGAISGRVGEDGAVETGNGDVLKDLVRGDSETVRIESIHLGRMLSEEIVPSDWASLIETIADKINSGTANGIVVTHGTDTLPYTAPILYWLFADAAAPVVLAASSTPPGVSTEAERAMKKAVQLALNKKKGVYVVHGGRVLSPLNLKFEKIGGDCFRNWNMVFPVFEGSSLPGGILEADRYVLSQLLEDAVNSMCVIRIYPGLRSDYLISLMEKGVKNFFLELFDTGTAGFREGPYSLKRAFAAGRRRGARFYCSSQQEGIVDFSGYATSRELWKGGAVPMGAYTTETAVARFLAASIIADSEEERAGLMEAEKDFGLG
ncbi:MAG: asparaginase domain-containing protein, partial [Spirochaetaceae bacterium]|nr:asparaginase domain-containing protein [Spirochaetaceae bacterium]